MSDPAPASASTSRYRWVGVWVALLALAGLAVVPYQLVLHLYPVGPDTPLWVHDMEPGDPDWVAHVFLRPHFIAYRPLAAFSFTLDGVFGPPPRGIRLGDVFFHLLAGFGAFAAWRALSDRVEHRDRWGVLVAALFWYSPLAELVVPFTSRRSYSVAAAFTFFAIAAGVRGIRTDRVGWTVLGAALLGLATLGNETAYVGGPLLVLSAVAFAPTWRKVLVHATPPALMVAAMFALRWSILRGVGGYGAYRMVAVVRHGEAEFIKRAPNSTIFAHAWRSATFPDDLTGDPMFVFLGGFELQVGLAIAAWASWFTVRRARAGDRVPLLLAVWALGYALVAVVGHIWFPRMGYAMGGVVCLWIAWSVRATVAAAPSAARWVDGALLLLILATRIQRATPLRGLDRRALRVQILGSQAIDRSLPLLAGLQGPARVWLGVNLAKSESLAVVTWLDHLAPDGVELRPLTHLVEPEHPRLVQTVVMDGGLMQHMSEAAWSQEVTALTMGSPYPIDPQVLLRDDRVPTWILDDGVLTRVLPEEDPDRAGQPDQAGGSGS